MRAGRVLGVDVGRRRVGLAISDPTGLLARPLSTIAVTSADDAVTRVAEQVNQLLQDEDGLVAIVVGVPARLDGTATEETATVQAFRGALAARVCLPVEAEDERLTSREAESRLAVTERDWRVRKKSIDAVAASIILQDYLDRRGTRDPWGV